MKNASPTAGSATLVAPPPWIPPLLAGAGFVHVTMVLCSRHNPLKTAHGSGYDLPVALLLVMAVALHWRTPAIFRQGGAVGSVSGHDAPFLAAFVAALHWQLMVHLTGVDFTLRSDGSLRLTPPVAAALAVAATLIGVLAALHFYWARRAGILSRYVVAFALPQVAIGLVTVAASRTHYLHYHHYLIGATLLPFACFRHPVSRAAQGLALGLFIEGAARWGFDPVWVLR